jgi:hypothetical protein
MNKYAPKHFMIDKRIVRDVELDKTLDRFELFDCIASIQKHAK